MTPERWRQVETILMLLWSGNLIDARRFSRKPAMATRSFDMKLSPYSGGNRSDDGVLDRPAWEAAPSLIESRGLTAGTRVGPYEIVAPIGAGGMGEVYLAKDTKLKREVALKVLPDSFASDPDRLARFERESQGSRIAQPPQHRADLRSGRTRPW